MNILLKAARTPCQNASADSESETHRKPRLHATDLRRPLEDGWKEIQPVITGVTFHLLLYLDHLGSE